MQVEIGKAKTGQTNAISSFWKRNTKGRLIHLIFHIFAYDEF